MGFNKAKRQKVVGQTGAHRMNPEPDRPIQCKREIRSNPESPEPSIETVVPMHSKDSLESRWVDTKKLAVILCMTVDAIRYHIKMGRIVPTVRLGRKMLFDPEAVLAQLKDQSGPKSFGKTARGAVSDSTAIFDNLLVERALGISSKEKL